MRPRCLLLNQCDALRKNGGARHPSEQLDSPFKRHVWRWRMPVDQPVGEEPCSPQASDVFFCASRASPKQTGHHNLFLDFRFWAAAFSGGVGWLAAFFSAAQMLARNKKLSIRAPTAAPNLRPR